jgi:hypothetical protein
MPEAIPPVTGKQLIWLFRQAGWDEVRRSKEGIMFAKRFPDGRFASTVISPTRRPLTPGTLGAIIGPRQSGIGRDGLAAWIEPYGLK